MTRVVLVHGAVDTAASFAEVVAHLPATLRAEAYDRRGFGEAWQVPVGSMLDHIDDLVTIVADTECVLIGHSMGGIVAMGVAVRRPELVRSVGLFETAAPWADWWSAQDRADLVERTQANADQAAARGANRRAQVAWQTCLRDVRSVLAPPFRWRDVKAPVTVAHGTASVSVSAQDAPQVAEALGASLVGLVGAGHLAHRTHPAAFAAFVRDCAGQVDDGGGTDAAVITM